MTIEMLLYVRALTLQEEYGLTKYVQNLILICNTLKKARSEKSIKKFLMKEGLIKAINEKSIEKLLMKEGLINDTKRH